VIRYIGLGGEGKQLIASEYKDLVTVFGAQNVLIVAEAGTGDAWGTDTDDDYARGVAYGNLSVADARAQGVPDWVPLACAADAHAQAFQLDDVVRYARGFEAAVGKPRCGFYGFSETLTAVHSAGIGSWYWRCGSEPTVTEKAWVNFWQRNTAPTVRTVAGVVCDINEVYHPITQGDDEMQADERYALFQVLAQMGGNTTGQWPGWDVKAAQPFQKATLVDFVRQTYAEMKATQAQLAALAQAVAAATNDPDISVDTLTQIVNEAVRQNIQITGEVHIGPAEGTAK
jgi:hypothetical protein